VECRIEVAEAPDHRLVRLSGRLAEAQVPDLIRVCGDNGPDLRLDLGDLISVDVVGLEALFQLRQRGVTLLELPAYIRLKLDARTARRPLSR
jgi:anti-anti-sigma regulatory factor